MEEALSFCFDLVRDSARTWGDLEKMPAQRIRFQNYAFPEKITYDGEKFGTPRLALIYALNQAQDADSTELVTLRGLEPRFSP